MQKLLISLAALMFSSLVAAQTTVETASDEVETRSALFEEQKAEQLDQIRNETQPFGHTLLCRLSTRREIFLFLM